MARPPPVAAAADMLAPPLAGVPWVVGRRCYPDKERGVTMGDRPTIRIRGIYATALSALLPEHGFTVVEASPVIAERLGLRPDGSADVRLRDRPDHQAVRLEGPRRAAAMVAR